MLIKGVLGIGSLLGMLFLFSFPSTHAQSPGNLNLTTSPLPISLRTKPGTSISTDLRVQNSGTATENLKIDLYKFRAYGTEGKPQIIDREPGDDYFDWVSFSQRTFKAEPNVWKTIKMTINVPSDAAFGYYYAVVFSRADQRSEAGEQSTAIVGGSATLVLLEADVPGAKRKISVSSFTSDKKFYEFLPATFRISLRNQGQVHGAPSGTIFISRGGKQVATLKVNADGGNILPSSSRNFSADWRDGFPVYTEKEDGERVVLDGNGKPVMGLEWDFDKPLSKLRFGKYTAKLVLAYDDGNRDVPIEGTLSFWVVPWRILLGIIIVVTLAGIGAWAIFKQIKGKVKKK